MNGDERVANDGHLPSRLAVEEGQPPRVEETIPARQKAGNPAPTVKSTQPTDYSLYKCSGCGQLVLGFDKKDHVRMVHGGDNPGFVRL